MSVLIIYNREVVMTNLQYKIAVVLTGCVISCSTVLATMDKLDPERYAMIALTLVAYWMPPPKNQIDKEDKD